MKFSINNQFSANLILITFDQFRGDWGDPYKPVIQLPGLTEIAEQGLTSSRCYTSSPQCIPARMSWITGMHPSQIGVTRNCAARVTQSTPSIIRDIQKKGWKTSIIGKTHWTEHNKPCDLRDTEGLIKQLGFDTVREVAGPRALRHVKCELTDEWDRNGTYRKKYITDMDERYKKGTDNAWKVKPTVLPNYLYPDIWIGDQARKELDNMPEDKPWLLWISFVGPHEPFDTPPPWNYGRYNIENARKQGDWIKNLDEDCELVIKQREWKSKKLNSKDLYSIRIDYANHIKLIDSQVESILRRLQRRSDWKKTAIYITADHGEMLGDAEMLYKSTFLEGSILVPMIYMPPRNSKGVRKQKSKKPCNSTEILQEVVRNLERSGFVGAIEKKIEDSSHVVVEYGREILIVKEEKKICLNRYTERIKWALDLETDRNEMNDLYKGNIENIKSSKDWREITREALNECKKRNQKGWQKIDLKTEN